MPRPRREGRVSLIVAAEGAKSATQGCGQETA